MRSSKNRSRSKGNRNRSVGNIVNRVFDSSGPEGKVRGTPQQIIDKYNQLARDATLGNDRVAAENFQQHAEHYTRMLGQAQREMEQRREQQEAQQQAQQQQRRDRQNQERDQDQPPQAGTGEQPDVVEASEAPSGGFDDVIDPGSADNGMDIVETAEEAPKPRNRRRRKPAAEAKAEAPPEPEAETQPDTPPEAAE